MRVIKDKIEKGYHDNKDDIITVFMALQKQNFVLANSLSNLIKHWPHYEEIFLVHSSEGIPLKVQTKK